ncbi:hypothetical protein [Rhizohabitans arisaemae]|uniref:hypothetical protein n=1 Tax=Rhizohabitans arisaemae TaxID=2720610 RepID=UPI0024B233B4|nr:hypothetical protein [Rhizohabitans arisaemae]
MRTSEQSVRDGRTDAKATRSGLSGPASRKLPVAPRERKPALAALAVLLILGGALATTLLVLRSGDRVSAIKIVSDVGAGQPVTAEAMAEVQVADTGLDYVAWRYRDQVTGYYAAVPLLAGTLLTEAMVTKSSELGPGKAVVGLALKAGQAPAGIRSGDRVQVVHVPGTGKGEPRVLAPNALVHWAGENRRGATGGGTVHISVVVPATISPALAAYAAGGEIAVAELPAGS